jgi:hypothetical protein
MECQCEYCWVSRRRRVGARDSSCFNVINEETWDHFSTLFCANAEAA